MRKLKGFSLTKNDTYLLHYLYANKVASIKQAKRDVYFNRSDSNTRKRFKILKDIGLISLLRSIKKRDQSYVYSLTKSGFQLVKKVSDINLCSNRFQSDSTEHDLVLVDIRNVLKDKSLVKKYFAENEINGYPMFDEIDEWSIYKKMRFDACFYCKKENGASRSFGLQYEQSQKRESDYQRIITDYYTDELIDYVLYVCLNKSIENKIKKVEAKIAKNDQRKIYFIQSKEFFQNHSHLVFTSQNGKKISFA